MGGRTVRRGQLSPKGRGSFGRSVPGLSPQRVGVTHGKILKWGFQVKREEGKEMLNAGEIVRLQELRKRRSLQCVFAEKPQASCSVGL